MLCITSVMLTILKTMKKKTTEQPKAEIPAFVDELLGCGKAVVKAPSPEALAELIGRIPAGTKYCSGPVGRDTVDFQYTVRIDLIP